MTTPNMPSAWSNSTSLKLFDNVSHGWPVEPHFEKLSERPQTAIQNRRTLSLWIRSVFGYEALEQCPKVDAMERDVSPMPPTRGICNVPEAQKLTKWEWKHTWTGVSDLQNTSGYNKSLKVVRNPICPVCLLNSFHCFCHVHRPSTQRSQRPSDEKEVGATKLPPSKLLLEDWRQIKASIASESVGGFRYKLRSKLSRYSTRLRIRFRKTFSQRKIDKYKHNGFHSLLSTSSTSHTPRELNEKHPKGATSTPIPGEFDPFMDPNWDKLFAALLFPHCDEPEDRLAEVGYFYIENICQKREEFFDLCNDWEHQAFYRNLEKDLLIDVLLYGMLRGREIVYKYLDKKIEILNRQAKDCRNENESKEKSREVSHPVAPHLVGLSKSSSDPWSTSIFEGGFEDALWPSPETEGSSCQRQNNMLGYHDLSKELEGNSSATKIDRPLSESTLRLKPKLGFQTENSASLVLATGPWVKLKTSKTSLVNLASNDVKNLLQAPKDELPKCCGPMTINDSTLSEEMSNEGDNQKGTEDENAPLQSSAEVTKNLNKRRQISGKRIRGIVNHFDSMTESLEKRLRSVD